MINAAQVKAMVKAAAEATPFVLEGEDPQAFTWYSIWSNAKDRPSKATYPLVAWDQWNTRLTTDENDMRVRTQLVRLMIVAQTATARTPEERDAMCNAADDAATNIVLAMEATYGDLVAISDVLITTMFDEFSTIETGVLLQFSVRGREAGCMEVAPGGTCTGVDILDNLGNLIAHVDDGDTYTITPMILPYDNRAAALADATTIPTTAQMVVINDTGRMYHGNGADDVAALVANPQVMYLPVREDGALLVTVEGVEYKLQLNA